jgi:hypothetical protein
MKKDQEKITLANWKSIISNELKRNIAPIKINNPPNQNLLSVFFCLSSIFCSFIKDISFWWKANANLVIRKVKIGELPENVGDRKYNEKEGIAFLFQLLNISKRELQFL